MCTCDVVSVIFALPISRAGDVALSLHSSSLSVAQQEEKRAELGAYKV